MYDSLSSFLNSFSADFPILWAFLVMIVIGGAGLGLYFFWEVVLGWPGSRFARRQANPPDRS